MPCDPFGTNRRAAADVPDATAGPASLRVISGDRLARAP